MIYRFNKPQTIRGIGTFLQRAIAVALVALPSVAMAETVLIKGARVITLSDAGTLPRADILIQDDRIQQVGTDLRNVRADQVLDAAGKVITPGIIAPESQLGLTEIGAAASTNDSAITDMSVGTAFAPVTAFNPRSTLIPFNRAGGLTRAVVTPSSEEKIFAGQGFAIRLTSDYDSVTHKALVQKIYLGEYGAQLAGGSRANAFAQVKSALAEAREYAQNKEQIERGAWRELNYPLADLEALQPLLRGEQIALISVNRASDILQVLELANEFNLKLVLEGAKEGWMVAEQLATAGVPVIIDPLSNSPTAFESLGARMENPALLHKAGVKLLISGPEYAGSHNSYLSRQGAGNAVAYGLPYEEGIRAISANVAEVFGLEGGAIKPGAVADLVIWSGDPLEVTSYAEGVMIDGTPQSLVNRSTRLRDRYLKPGAGYEHAYKE